MVISYKKGWIVYAITMAAMCSIMVWVTIVLCLRESSDGITTLIECMTLLSCLVSCVLIGEGIASKRGVNEWAFRSSLIWTGLCGMMVSLLGVILTSR